MYNETVDSISGPLTSYWDGFVGFVPQLVASLIVLIVGLIVASIISAIVGKLLKLAEDSKVVRDFLKRWNINLKISTFVSKFIWWGVFLVFLSAAVSILKIEVLTNSINMIVAFMPAVFAAAVVAIVVLIGARVIRSLLESAFDGMGFKQGKLLATVVYVVILVFGLTTAAAQLGIDMTLLNANLSIIIAGIVLALALAFGLGGRDVAGKIVGNVYDSVKASGKKK